MLFKLIGHFTATWPMIASDLTLIQISMLFSLKYQLVSSNNLLETTKALRSVSKQGHFQPHCHSKARSLSRELQNDPFDPIRCFFKLLLLTCFNASAWCLLNHDSFIGIVCSFVRSFLRLSSVSSFVRSFVSSVGP